jgi:tripeptidyl-peptidase-1
MMTFTIALNRDFGGLEQMLLDVSTPGSAKYGKFLSKDEVNQLFPAASGSTGKCISWLNQHGITNYKVDAWFIDFTTDIETANRALSASYEHFEKDGTTKLRTLQYSIPDELQSTIAFIEPGTFFGKAKPPVSVSASKVKREVKKKAPVALPPSRVQRDMPTKPTVAPSCQTSITPACLKAMYNVGDYTPDPKYGSRIGFASFLNESALYSDLFQFEDFNSIPKQNFTKILIANGTNDQDPANNHFGESDLDVQNMIGIAHPLPVTEFITGGSP